MVSEDILSQQEIIVSTLIILQIVIIIFPCYFLSAIVGLVGTFIDNVNQYLLVENTFPHQQSACAINNISTYSWLIYSNKFLVIRVLLIYNYDKFR